MNNGQDVKLCFLHMKFVGQSSFLLLDRGSASARVNLGRSYLRRHNKSLIGFARL